MIGGLFVIGLNIVYILNVCNEALNTERLFLIFVGCIFIIIGSFLPTVNYNSKVGVRNTASFQNKNHGLKFKDSVDVRLSSVVYS